MKTLIFHLPSLVAALVLCALAMPAAGLAATPAAAVTPFTFTGRVMDSHHAGFDTNRVCTLSAYSEEGNLLAATKSTYRAGLRDNYVLKIPVSTANADDYAMQSNALVIVATDDTRNTWQGVVPDALCGAAGTLRRVDIVLGSDTNGDGIDDALYDELLALWDDSKYWRYGEDFDPHADYDGDGVSTLAEAYAGTYPFDPEDVLRITSFNATSRPATKGTRGAAESKSFALTFQAIAGRAYSVESTTNLAEGAWTTASFTLPDSDNVEKAISISSSNASDIVPVTLYLLPTDDAARFYRVRLE